MTSGYTVYGHAPVVFSPFRSAFPWVGGDLQTIRNTVTRADDSVVTLASERIQLPMNDGTGDSLLGLVSVPQGETTLPLLVLIHGLTGSESSENIVVSAKHFASLGFPVLRLNLRGAGPSLGLCKEHYHAGRTQDLSAALAALPEHLSRNGFLMVGVSLGGNTLLKFAAETAQDYSVHAVVSVSAPIDLKMSQQRLMASRNIIYHRYLLDRMKADALVAAEDKAAITETLKDVRSVYDYDDLIVAPPNNFDGAEDYYKRCSATYVLDQIKIPTLLIHAATDPWIPLSMYMDHAWPADGPLSLIVSEDGGHVGFHTQGTSVPWHDVCTGEYFLKVLSA